MQDDSDSAQQKEWIQEEDKVPVIVVEPYGPSFVEAIQGLQKDPMVQLIECPGPIEAVSIAEQFDNCVLLFHGFEFKDIAKQVAMLRLLKDGLASGNVKSIFTSYLDQKTILNKLALAGCHEMIREPISAKSLQFKVGLQVKAIKTLATQQGPDGQDEGLIKAKGEFGVKSKNGPSMFRFAPPSENENNFWCLSRTMPRVVGGKWVIRIFGPPPTIGSWEATGQEDVWVWNIKNPTSHPPLQAGHQWFFKGQKPNFKMGHWWMVSKAPELICKNEGKQVSVKLRVESNGVLILTRDSKTAFKVFTDYKKAAEASVKRKVAPGPATESAKFQDRKGGVGYQFVDPLPLKSDCWLIEDLKPKWLKEVWNIRLRGPLPEMGQWVAVGGGSEAASKTWRWEYKLEVLAQFSNMNPAKDDGNWEFTGYQPRVEENCWIFSSKHPNLSFISNKTFKSLGSKLAVNKEGLILISEDSFHAKRALDPKKLSAFAPSPAEKAVPSESQVAPEKSDSKPQALEVDAKKFGNPPGKWKKAGEDGRGESLFLYFPFENVNGLEGATPMSKQPIYWVYRGKTAPELLSMGQTILTKIWVFRGNAAESFQTFSTLDPLIQNYIKKTEGKPEVRSSSQMKEAIANYKKVIKEEGLSKPSIDKKVEDAASQRSNLKVEKVELLNLEISQPQVSPLALSILVSELASLHPNLPGNAFTLRDAARFYCKFVSGAFNGIRTELWITRKGQWSCINSFDGSEGQFKKSFQSVEFFPQMSASGTLVAPVIAEAAGEEQILGALVFGGEGVDKIPADSTLGYSMMAQGLVLAFVD